MAEAMLLFDAECNFCAWSVAPLLRWDRARRLRPVAIQSDEGRRLLADMPPDERLASWHLVGPDGRRHSAGAAFPHLFRLLPGGRPIAVLTAAAPRLFERAYRWVADHRSGLSDLVPAGSKRRAWRRVTERGAEERSEVTT